VVEKLEVIRRKVVLERGGSSRSKLSFISVTIIKCKHLLFPLIGWKESVYLFNWLVRIGQFKKLF